MNGGHGGTMQRIEAVIFDKDGTLFDFRATWEGWTGAVIAELSAGDDALAGRLGDAIGYNPASGFSADSPVIAETAEIIARRLAAALPGTDAAELAIWLDERAAAASMREAVPLRPLLGGLGAAGLRLGVATNDAEAAARAHLASAGVLDLFALLSGYDSGHRPKPAPDMLLAFARHCGIDAGRIAMVGDSAHDLVAARRAGMRAVAVLTGVAGPAELSPLADHILPDIGHLPRLLGLAAG